MILDTGLHWKIDWGLLILFLIVIGALAYLLAFPLLIAKAAKGRGRSAVGWFFISIFFSPILAMLLLIAMGDSEAKRKEKWMHEERMNHPAPPRQAASNDSSNWMRTTFTVPASQPTGNDNDENNRLKTLLEQSRRS